MPNLFIKECSYDISPIYKDMFFHVDYLRVHYTTLLNVLSNFATPEKRLISIQWQHNHACVIISPFYYKSKTTFPVHLASHEELLALSRVNPKVEEAPFASRRVESTATPIFQLTIASRHWSECSRTFAKETLHQSLNISWLSNRVGITRRRLTSALLHVPRAPRGETSCRVILEDGRVVSVITTLKGSRTFQQLFPLSQRDNFRRTLSRTLANKYATQAYRFSKWFLYRYIQIINRFYHFNMSLLECKLYKISWYTLFIYASSLLLHLL